MEERGGEREGRRNNNKINTLINAVETLRLEQDWES